jgi:hypothetical protein
MGQRKGYVQTEDHAAKKAAAVRARFAVRTHKICPRCSQSLPVETFKKRREDGSLESYCPPCKAEYARQRALKHYHGNPEAKLKSSITNRKTNLAKYGLTEDCYNKMLEEQGGVCAICSENNPGGRRKYMAVDHDHSTGVVRGILCNNCNRALGLLKDNADILRRAADYIQKGSPPPANENLQSSEDKGLSDDSHYG